MLVAVAAIGANAQFKGSVDVKYKMEPREQVIGFNFSRVCQQLGVDKDEFGILLWNQWFRGASAEHDYSLYLLTDGGGGVLADYKLTADGRKAGDSDGLWKCSIVPHNIIERNRLDFCVSPCTDGSDDEYPLGKVGDTYNAVFALECQGRIATFDITMNITKEEGPAIPLSSMEKIGEKVLSAHLDFAEENTLYFDLADILPLFGDDVEGSNLQLFVMSDAERQLVIGSNVANQFFDLKIDGMVSTNRKAMDYYVVRYNGYGGAEFSVAASSDVFKGGQKTSGSVFLVADGKYYELILDIQFGDEYADQENFDIVKTEQLDVQLMWTENYFSYRNREDGRFGLISTDIDEAEVKKLIGTNSPRLYAEQKDGNAIAYTSRYNAAPGQGFWFTSDGGQCYRQNSNYRSIGAYYTEGSLKWYESPSLELDDRFQVNLYLANPENGKAVKYEIGIELVKELQTESVAYVRKLPIGMDDTNGIHSAPMPQPTSSALYDLSGRRLQQKPAKGIYIEGGKMILVK